MNRFQRALAYTVLALAAGMVSLASVADERSARSAQWVEGAARQAQEAQRRQREARLRWEYERRRSAAHARMPNTLYASTPSNQAHTDLACPVLVDDDTRHLYQDSLKGQGPSSRALRAPDLFRSGSSSKWSSSSRVRVFSTQGPGTANPSPWKSKSTPNDGAASHRRQVSGWAAVSVQPKSGTDATHHVYLVPSASEPLRQGFVRVINHSAEAGEVSIDPVDDGGRAFDTITLSIDANETIHFNSNDLETGNEGKGLTGSTGSGEGDWRLAFTSDLDIEVLAYIRTTDGFLTAMHDVAPVDGDIRRVAIFNPGSNKNQVSRLRLINPADSTAEVSVRGTDDKGMPGSGEVSLALDAGTAREISAEQLEEGGSGLAGVLGDGSGKWRLQVESEQAVVAMSLLESPTDHLTNLSTVPELPEDGVHGVPLFPAAGDDSGRQGFVRAINRSDTAGEIRIQAYDETERDYEAVTLTIGANEVVHFNSDDLEQGSPQKGLSGGTGAGEGDWRLELTSDLEIEVLSYIRTTDGFLTAMHDVVPSAETRHRVAVFNPGSNRNQESLLRLINPADETAEVMITGVDDKGAAGTSAVGVSLVGGSSRTVGAWDLEYGAEGLDGALGDGAGKWQLMIESDRPVVAMSLLKSPTGHLTNLSTAPVRGAEGGAIGEPVGQTAEEVFQTLITGPIVQTKCINCHVEGGASANTRLVFVDDTDPDHEAINLQVFQDFLAEVEDGAGYILNKIQGALGHGGGIQVAAGTEDYVNMERFLTLLGEDVGPVGITPDTLFDGVKMESSRSTLRRAAIVFAGRIPTEEEYESIETSGLASLRAAIRNLMGGAEFHEFLIRGANDRLLTDRDELVLDNDGYFVDFDNKHFELATTAAETGDHYEQRLWGQRVQYGVRRAPLELIAYVVENDLPYTDILTADYIMANPWSAEAYGASTEFADPTNANEFRPSSIMSYYRQCDGLEHEQVSGVGLRVVDPGPCGTVWPHAGILNTKVFLQRYPTTPTNRNRARSRWTYYHFLGVDVEKSAPRTTDPVALADTNNPTMHNPACTVCHSVLDPVAGIFQNYGDEGYYRDQWGGLDALDEFYKNYHGARETFEITAKSLREAQTISVATRLKAGREVIRVSPSFDPPEDEGREIWWNMGIDRIVLLDVNGLAVFAKDAETLGLECGREEAVQDPETGEGYYEAWFCEQEIPIEVPASGEYELKVTLWEHVHHDDVQDERRLVTVSTGGHQPGETWYRDMRDPGFDGELMSNDYTDNSLQWLAQRIAEDERFAEATVKFWWPIVMGSDVAEPPEEEDDAGFEGLLLASNAQTAEVKRLAGGFRQGFHGRPSFNMKDLLVELVLSNWFRAEWAPEQDSVRSRALRDAGARRLLTPEELAHKTNAVTGFNWRRYPSYEGPLGYGQQNGLSSDYLLLYGGIDSGGVTERARDLTSVMASVAKTLAVESSCPIVLREFYLLPDNERRLFSGIDESIYPYFQAAGTFAVEAASWADRETLSLASRLVRGTNHLTLRSTNYYLDEDTGRERHAKLDRIVIRDATDTPVQSVELESLDLSSQRCSTRETNDETGGQDYVRLWGRCSLTVPIQAPEDGEYKVEIVVWADQLGDELAELQAVVESEASHSVGSAAIRNTLVDLHDKLLGMNVDVHSREIEETYQLFVDVWTRKRDFARSGSANFFEPLVCNFALDRRFFEGILEDVLVVKENDHGEPFYDWDWDRVNDFVFSQTDPQDPAGAARTWVVVLAHLLMDYRYLYL